MLLGHGITTPKFYVPKHGHSLHNQLEPVRKKLRAPWIVKPISGGSSIGTRLIENEEQVRDFYENPVDPKYPVFVEEFIKGRIFTVGILELEFSLAVFPIVEALLDTRFYDEDVKLDEKGEGRVCYQVPAQLDSTLSEDIQHISANIHDFLGCRGFSRIDFILDESSKHYVLEINTIPGISLDSNFVAGATALGLSYDEMILAMLRSCLWEK